MRICQGADLFEHFIYAVYVFRPKTLRVLPVISFPEFIVGPEFARKQTALKRTVRKDTQTLVQCLRDDIFRDATVYKAKRNLVGDDRHNPQRLFNLCYGIVAHASGPNLSL